MTRRSRLRDGAAIRSLALCAVVLSAAGSAAARGLALIQRNPPPEVAENKRGVHVEPGRPTGFTVTMTDGGGYQWEIDFNATINHGTRKAFGSAADMMIDGGDQIMESRPGTGWMSFDSREIEVGPWKVAGLTVYRRVRVYADRPLCRWLDIIENPSNAPVKAKVRVFTDFDRDIRRIEGPDGGPAKWAFVSDHGGPDGKTAAPNVLFVIGDAGERLKPVKSHSGQMVIVDWQLTVPAGETVVLCHFMSQGPRADLKRIMHQWRIAPLLKDLPLKARKRIVNLDAVGGGGGPCLLRDDSADRVELLGGQSMLGSVANASFTLTDTPLGRLELPAAKVLGMAAGRDGRMLAVLTDGQVVSGKAAGAKLQLALPGSGTLRVPFEKIRQWSYRISKARPQERPSAGAALFLDGGDRLAIESGGAGLEFRTPHGALRLPRQCLLEAAALPGQRGRHRALLLNGSQLTGSLADEELVVRPRWGGSEVADDGTLAVAVRRIERISFADRLRPDCTLTRMELADGGELFGSLTGETFRLITAFGDVDVGRPQVRTIRPNSKDPNATSVEMFNGTVLTGRLAGTHLDVEIAPTTTLRVAVERIVSVTRAQPETPGAAGERIARLIARLGAESYKDREAATKALGEIGPRIGPMLKRHRNDSDPEVRQRIEKIIQQIEPPSPNPKPPEHTAYGSDVLFAN